MTRLPRRDQLRHRVPSRNHDYSRWLTTQFQPPDWRYERDHDFYTYRFIPPRHQHDPVLRRINETIRELMHGHKHGIAMCNTNFRVFQTTDSPNIFPPSGFEDTKLYTFIQDHEGFPATAPVYIIPPKAH